MFATLSTRRRRVPAIAGLLAVCAGLIVASGAARADAALPWEKVPDELAQGGVDEHLGAQLPLDLVFRREDGQFVSLSQVFSGNRPVILSFNYSNCPMLCNLQLQGLVNVLRDLEWSAGTQFDVVSISIDPLETPQRAGQTRQRYFQQYGRPGTGSGWRFLVGGPKEIRTLTNAAGFKYQYVTERREYAHPAVFLVCTPSGRISQYLHGIEFPKRTLELALVEAGEGKVGSTLDQFILFCFHYDSKTGQYTPAARNLMKLAGLATLFALSMVIITLLRRERLARRAGPIALPQHHPAVR